MRILRAFGFVVAFLLFGGLVGATQINTSARCPHGATCDVGDLLTTAIALVTDGASFGVDVTANTATLTATTTNTAVFTGADAAGAANTTYDTTGAGAITVGSADVTAVTVTTDGASFGVDTTTNAATLTATTTATAVFTGADAAGAANTTYDTTGAGSVTIGSADVTSVPIVTDGGTVTVDGSIASTANDMGWAVVAGANTACTTTCTSACVFGVDTASLTADIVNCADATADECLCAGGS